ncbi:MAG: phage minor head protein [Eubacteriales bacterium]
MNKRQAEVAEWLIGDEKKVLKEVEHQYQKALSDIDDMLAKMLGRDDADAKNVIYRIAHQKALRAQVSGILDQLHSNEFSSISDFLSASYTNAFIGTMYDMHGQGVPLILQIDPQNIVRAVVTDSKIKGDLYTALGVDVANMKKAISSEISRGIASGMSYNEIARNISAATNAPLGNTRKIVRTESHRIQQASCYDAQKDAKSKGADVLKQWDATLDGNTRDTHRQLDGQIRELDEPFEIGGNKAMYPGDFGDPAEDCNCRCQSLQRARWALDNDELKTLQERAEFFGLDKTENFEEFRKNYFIASESPIGSIEALQKYSEDLLKKHGISVDISKSVGVDPQAVKDNIDHFDRLLSEYNSTCVSYVIERGNFTEGGSAYMLNGNTSIKISTKTLRNKKATDIANLGDNQYLGVTYHEFAHSLSQSREKIDTEFWKELRKVQREYNKERDGADWFSVRISSYADKDIDEFLSEAFMQAKLGISPSPYSYRVLAIVDKYFKKK